MKIETFFIKNEILHNFFFAFLPSSKDNISIGIRRW